jgi:hypothetical protein
MVVYAPIADAIFEEVGFFASVGCKAHSWEFLIVQLQSILTHPKPSLFLRDRE